MKIYILNKSYRNCAHACIYTLLNVVVVGTRNNTHNTIQLHTLLNVVVVGTRNNTHNTIQLHTLLNVVVVGTRNNTHNTIQLHTLLMLLLCVTYEPSYLLHQYSVTSVYEDQ